MCVGLDAAMMAKETDQWAVHLLWPVSSVFALREACRRLLRLLFLLYPITTIIFVTYLSSPSLLPSYTYINLVHFPHTICLVILVYQQMCVVLADSSTTHWLMLH
jgi:hypothetical protein